MGRLARLLGAAPVYARIAWWGLASPRYERAPLVVVQAVVVGEDGVLLCVRSDLRGFELPGGTPEPGESAEAALRREVREETGLAVAVEAVVGDYLRSGFRPHRARVFRCRVVGGVLAPGPEVRGAAWFGTHALPDTLFPWARAPLADALASAAAPVERREHQGLASIAAGLAIDLRMRWKG